MNRFLIFGPYRSRTTLIQRIINLSYPKLISLGESSILLYKFFELSKTILESPFEKLSIETIKNTDDFQPWTSFYSSTEINQFYTSFANLFLDKLMIKDNFEWCGLKEVSISTDFFIPCFKYFFNQLNFKKIIFVKRNPQDILVSRINAPWASDEMKELSWQNEELKKIHLEISLQEEVQKILGSDNVLIINTDNIDPNYLMHSLDQLFHMNGDLGIIQNILSNKLGSSFN